MAAFKARPDAVGGAALLGLLSKRKGHKNVDLAMQVLTTLDQAHIQPDNYVYGPLLNICRNENAVEQGKYVHKHMLMRGWKPNAFIMRGLLNFYAKCGNAQDAHQLFNSLPEKTPIDCDDFSLCARR